VLSTETPLPTWVTSIRPHQQAAVDEIMEHYHAGVKAVFLDGPTGTGKTLIGEMVRRRQPELDQPNRGLYVCSDKQLQDQFLGDFPYAKVLKGRANYPTLDGGPEVTADDCTSSAGSRCMWCSERAECPYQVAKRAAVEAELAVLNTSYLLTEANLPSGVAQFSRQPFVIADEADTLEHQLLSHIGFELGYYYAKELNLLRSIPKKGAHKPTIAKWLVDAADRVVPYIRARGDRLEPKQRRRWRQFEQSCRATAVELQLDRDSEQDDAGKWIRDYDTKTLKLVPVTVTRYGPKKLWRHGRRWLLMSATLISPDQLAEDLGLPFEYETVTVPMTFPVENRPVYMAGIANIRYGCDEGEYVKLADAVAKVCERHPGERVLVHTVSYNLNRRLRELLVTRVTNRRVVTYEQAREKVDAIELYRRTPGAVLLAPSASRGVDLKDDDCRVVVIAKAPFPSLGDKRVSARHHLPGGGAWYLVQTVRDVVQMTGRGMRHEDDWCASYILDSNYVTNVWQRGKHLHPRWWRDAVDHSFSPRLLMKGSGG
jgi:Rad3-related DNA helicase